MNSNLPRANFWFRYARLGLFCSILLLSLGGGLVHAQTDTTPPQLASFSFTPTSIDTNGSAQSVAVTARITDDLSGAQSSIGVSFISPTGRYINGAINRVSGTGNDGTYQGSVVFPRYVEPGAYNVGLLRLYDVVGNYRPLSQSDLASMGFQTALQVSSTQDVTPPRLVEFSFSPSSSGPDGSPRTVNVRARITDDMSGTQNSIGVSFIGAAGQYVNGAVNRVSGTGLDGVYEGQISFPHFLQPGLYRAGLVRLYDQVENNKELSATELTASGFQTVLLVDVAPSDSTIRGRVVRGPHLLGVRALVTLRGPGEEVKMAVTNPLGYFRFTNISPPNIYAVEVRAKIRVFTDLHVSGTDGAFNFVYVQP
jgi:hypothetical protein